MQITFKPKNVTKALLAVLPERPREVLVNRYGLGKDATRQTLEAIGNTYGITRERVRQIENHAIGVIRGSGAFEDAKPAFDELSSAIDSMGGIVYEEELLSALAKDASTQNHIHFLLVVGDPFKKEKENDEFYHRWYTDEDFAEKIHQSLRRMYENLSDDDLIPESEMIDSLLDDVADLNQEYKDREIAKRWLSLSKRIDSNPLGEWGRAHSPNIHVKGMRDYAYLVIKRNGSPMHFREVADAIGNLFDKKAHTATCHNELIKDERFVLVGRGLYALSEWGYTAGVVKDVLQQMLRQHGPLSREDIVERMRKERYVKDNTILVNLQDPRYFKKTREGLYTVV